MSTKTQAPKKAARKTSNGNSLKMAIKIDLPVKIKKLKPLSWSKKQQEVIDRLASYDRLPLAELKNSRDAGIYTYLMQQTEKECSRYYNIITDERTSERKKRQAHKECMQLPTVESLIERAKNYHQELSSMLALKTKQDVIMDACFQLLSSGDDISYSDSFEFWAFIKDLRTFFLSNPESFKAFVSESNIRSAKIITDVIERLIDFFDEIGEKEGEEDYLHYAVSKYYHAFTAEQLIKIANSCTK